MNKYGQHNKAPTQTKKQRKKVNSPIAESIKTGDVIQMLTATYRGSVPQYNLVTKEDGSKWWLKIAKGIPFVKVIPA